MLKGEAIDTWLELVEDQLILSVEKYSVDNAFEVDNFETNQQILAKVLLDEEPIEDLKIYLQNTKNRRKMRIDDYIRRVKSVNNYTSFIDIGTFKLTEREMI